MRGRVSGTCNSDRHLWEAYAADFPDAPRTSTRVATLVTTVAAWLATHHPPEETPGDGWGHWMVEAAGGDVVPVPTDHCRELRLALDGIVDRDQDLGRFLSQITPLRRDRALAESSGVRVMTMIGSKGLTVRATVLAGLDDGIVPRRADVQVEHALPGVRVHRRRHPARYPTSDFLQARSMDRQPPRLQFWRARTEPKFRNADWLGGFGPSGFDLTEPKFRQGTIIRGSWAEKTQLEMNAVYRR
jgi:hypothetical protein